MNIAIDLGHPAHVHYFRNFIRIMEQNGHQFMVSARERSIIHYLLDYYNIPFFSRGRGKNSVIVKILYMLVADLKIFRKALKFKPDIFLSFASPYAAQVAWLMRKPHIVMDDTEHAKFGHLFYKPFSAVLLNPSCFYKNFGKKQIKFNSYMELCYLHNNYFTPSDEVYNILGIAKDQKFVLLRFVSWQANHDYGHSGLNLDTKKQLVKLLSEKFKVFISKEASNDDFLKEYELNIPPEKVHDVLYFAELFVTESGTMASEAAVLGTPVVYVNSLPLMGYLNDQKEAGLLFHYSNSEGVVDQVKKLMDMVNLKDHFTDKTKTFLQNKIDPTTFLVWFIQNYPQSMRTMQENPDDQYTFRLGQA
ncbi:MAG: DUF354 domain-containing protein [Bacteroidetes bacterium]|jgi:predicted glycosyltransferase|nr:DUF354 domain-containing protein [Bacteroidota bacterium]